ncbi:MAG: hypothetical protein ACLTK0_09975 [Anaerovoracaceae bacterium]
MVDFLGQSAVVDFLGQSAVVDFLRQSAAVDFCSSRLNRRNTPCNSRLWDRLFDSRLWDCLFAVVDYTAFEAADCGSRLHSFLKRPTAAVDYTALKRPTAAVDYTAFEAANCGSRLHSF